MKIIRGIVATFFTFTFISILLGTLFLFTLNSVFAPDNVVNMVTEINIDNATIMEEVFDIELTDEHQEMIDLINESPEMEEVLADFVGRITDYLLFEGELPTLSEEDIDRMMQSAILYYDVEEELAEYRLQLEVIADDLNAIVAELLEEEMGELTDEAFFPILRDLLSPSTRTYFIYALLIVVVLIALTLWSWHKPLAWIGIGTTIGGTIFLLIGIVGERIFLGEDANEVLEVIVSNFVFSRWNTIAITTIVAGIAIFVAFKLINYRIRTGIKEKELNKKTKSLQ